VANPTLHLHFYLPIASNYSVDNFANYLRGSVADPTDPEPPSDRFDTAGVFLDFKTKAVSGTADFKKSLQDADSVVVYLGHSVLDYKNKRSLGLSPLAHDPAEIAPDALMSLLKASKTKLVILATCASSTLGLEKLKAGPAVMVTNSGSNLKTWSFSWVQALQPFLLLLIGYEVGKNDQPVARNKGRATIKEALDASNAAFKENKADDRFELAHGEPSTVVFPEKEITTVISAAIQIFRHDLPERLCIYHSDAFVIAPPYHIRAVISRLQH
jgi:hypothetical protein